MGRKRNKVAQRADNQGMFMQTFRGGIFAGLVLAVQHYYIVQILGAFLAFATVYWTEWVRDRFKRRQDADAEPKPKPKRRKRARKAAV